LLLTEIEDPSNVRLSKIHEYFVAIIVLALIPFSNSDLWFNPEFKAFTMGLFSSAALLWLLVKYFEKKKN
jgi:hypothetical protein